VVGAWHTCTHLGHIGQVYFGSDDGRVIGGSRFVGVVQVRPHLYGRVAGGIAQIESCGGRATGRDVA
jgi:hypothetical protein